jgi:excisionase family DNA binding protein
MNADTLEQLGVMPLAVDTDTAARMLGLSPSTIRAYIRRGDLVPRYSGTKPLLPVEDLKEFLVRLPSEPRR